MGVSRVYLRRKGNNLRETIPGKNDDKLSFQSQCYNNTKLPMLFISASYFPGSLGARGSTTARKFFKPEP